MVMWQYGNKAIWQYGNIESSHWGWNFGNMAIWSLHVEVQNLADLDKFSFHFRSKFLFDVLNSFNTLFKPWFGGQEWQSMVWYCFIAAHDMIPFVSGTSGHQLCRVPEMCGAKLFLAGRGGNENPRGGVGRRWKSAGRSGAGQGEDENPRGGPGRGGAKKRVNQLIQKFDKSA